MNCIHSIDGSGALFASMFMAGLAGSMAHCTPMCGGIVLGQIGALPENKSSFLNKMLLSYHAGRITTYALLAGIFGFIFGLASMYGLSKIVLTVLFLSFAAILFLVTAFTPLAQVFPALANVKLPYLSRVSESILRKFSLKPYGLQGYFLGMALGLMPCGLVVAALMAASTASSALGAMLAMISFGAGTMPVLVLFAVGGALVKRRFPAQAKILFSFILVMNAMFLIWFATRMVI